MLLKLLETSLLSLILSAVLTLGLLSPNKALADQTGYNEQLCNVALAFTKKPKVKQQTLKLNATVTMVFTNALAINNNFSAKLASNVTCQQLTGANYTGSEAEWIKFFNSASQGLLKANYKQLTFTLVGENDKNFQIDLGKNFIAKEYDYTGTIDGNKQLIKNLALLDKSKNTLYTFSVSGNELIESNVRLEFERLLASIKVVK